ncbi:MAG TPA: formate dehydrogenase accessory protein FdhE [Rhodocyclaceae bacterium]
MMGPAPDARIARMDDGSPPHVAAADPATIFAARAHRFRELARDHALGDWLRFLGRLADAQHAALRDLPSVPLPNPAAIENAHRNRMPPAPAHRWRPKEIWRDVLHGIVATLQTQAPPTVQKSLALLAAMVPGQLDGLAQRVLHREPPAQDRDLLPFVAAALQVTWTATAARLAGIGLVHALDVPGVCPCCGSLPVASVVRGAGEVANVRYLHCSLCETEWNLARIKCAACASSGRIAYHYLAGEGQPEVPAVRAESCDECGSYLKILYRDKAPRADAVADDLATLALDVLLDEAGYARAGPNLLFVPGPG